MKIIHISYGGPDRQIRDATGKVWRFEMHPHFGPAAQDTKGELLEAQRRRDQRAVIGNHSFQGADFIGVLFSSSCEFFRLAISFSV